MQSSRFTELAQKVLSKAVEEANGFAVEKAGTEFILLSLLSVREGIAYTVLTELGFTYEEFREDVASIYDVSGDSKYVGTIERLHFTPRARQVISDASSESTKLAHTYVGTEHILLGILASADGVAKRMFDTHGVTITSIRTTVMRAIGSVSVANKKTFTPTPTLDSLSKDLTKMAEEGKIDPVIGRKKEIRRAVEVLSRRTKNNPVLIGEPGVGKTAVAEGLALLIASGNVPKGLKDKRVMMLDMGSVVAGTKYRGEFEERLKKMTDEISEAGNILLFVDELHTLIGAGGSEGSLDASNILKPALSRGTLQCIGATTLDEFKKYIEKDAALERRFQPVNVDEPTIAETLEILTGLRSRYEEHHELTFTDGALEAAVKLSDRYISDRFLPDKAIDLMDEAGSKVRIRLFESPNDVKDLELELEEVLATKNQFVFSGDFEKAAKLRNEEQKLKERIRLEQDGLSLSEGALVVTEDDVAEVVALWTGVPVTKLVQTENERLLNLEKTLHERVIGQHEAVVSISKSVRRARAGLKNAKRPIGSFMFLGPTGVGKTELAKALAESMFGDESAMIRLDMSEFMEKHTVSRLVGSPPGYVGYEDGGQLTEKVRRKPYSVILLDEVEKAHPDVFNVLLQVLDDGRLTDAKGRVVDFSNTLLIMTSNIGSGALKDQKNLGFSVATAESKQRDLKKVVIGELKKAFRPEFINRLDDTVVFHSLEREHLDQIVTLLTDDLIVRMLEKDILIDISKAAKEQIAKDGYDPEYGARPIRRSIQRNLEDLLSEELLSGNLVAGVPMMVDFKKDKFIVKKVATRKKKVQ